MASSLNKIPFSQQKETLNRKKLKISNQTLSISIAFLLLLFENGGMEQTWCQRDYYGGKGVVAAHGSGRVEKIEKLIFLTIKSLTFFRRVRFLGWKRKWVPGGYLGHGLKLDQ